MFDWAIHSLSRQVATEVRRQRATNPALLAARHSVAFRIVRALLVTQSFWMWMVGYLGLAVLASVVDGAGMWACLSLTCPTAPDAVRITDGHTHLLFEIGGYLIGAQVGALAALSIAVSLVTLIGQNGNADADVQVYYYESLTLPIVASSVALLAVLCTQLVWPIPMVAKGLGFATATLSVAVTMTGVHLLWLFLNLAAFAHFAIVSLSFGQPESRAVSRRRYTAAYVIPEQLRGQLLQAYYFNLPQALSLDIQPSGPTVWFHGWSLNMPLVALSSDFSKPHRLVDVWQRPLGWALRSWLKRVNAANLPNPQHILLSFCVGIGQQVDGPTVLCRRRGGLPLNRLEQALVHMSLRFQRVR